MLISIITISFNNYNGLEKTIKSVISQSYNNFEFIIIDGGSTDNSLDLIKQHDSRISYWISERDNGAYQAMNKGLAKANGDYCIFLNSGDYFNSTTILSQVSDLIKGDEDLIYGLIKWEEFNLMWNPEENFKHFEIAFHSPIPHQASFFKVSTLIKMKGYNENYKIISDWAVMLEMVLGNRKIKKISLVVSKCETQGLSSINNKKILKERIHYLLKYSKMTLISGYIFYLKNKLRNYIKKLFK